MNASVRTKKCSSFLFSTQKEIDNQNKNNERNEIKQNPISYPCLYNKDYLRKTNSNVVIEPQCKLIRYTNIETVNICQLNINNTKKNDSSWHTMKVSKNSETIRWIVDNISGSQFTCTVVRAPVATRVFNKCIHIQCGRTS